MVLECPLGMSSWNNDCKTWNFYQEYLAKMWMSILRENVQMLRRKTILEESLIRSIKYSKLIKQDSISSATLFDRSGGSLCPPGSLAVVVARPRKKITRGRSWLDAVSVLHRAPVVIIQGRLWLWAKEQWSENIRISQLNTPDIQSALTQDALLLSSPGAPTTNGHHPNTTCGAVSLLLWTSLILSTSPHTCSSIASASIIVRGAGDTRSSLAEAASNSADSPHKIIPTQHAHGGIAYGTLKSQVPVTWNHHDPSWAPTVPVISSRTRHELPSSWTEWVRNRKREEIWRRAFSSCYRKPASHIQVYRPEQPLTKFKRSISQKSQIFMKKPIYTGTCKHAPQ